MRLVGAKLIVARHDGRSQGEAVQIDCGSRSCGHVRSRAGGSSAYGGLSESAAPSPIKLGVLTPLTGPFAPWGIQGRAGAALAVNEINRAGGVKGRGEGDG